MANVGLSGGFGTIALGQIWSASYNSAGAITNPHSKGGDSYTSFRNGHSVSYSNSAGGASFQVDAIMDPKRKTGSAVDQYEFGMTFGIGDIGKVAIAYVKAEDETAPMLEVHKPGFAGQKQVDAVAPTYWINMEEEDDDVHLEEVSIYVDAGVAANVGDGTDAMHYFKDDKGTMEAAHRANVLKAIKSYRTADGKVVHGIDADSTSTGSANTLDNCDTSEDENKCVMVTFYVDSNSNFGTDNDGAPTPGTNTEGVATVPGAGTITTSFTYYLAVDNKVDSDHDNVLERGAEDGKFQMDAGNAAIPAEPYRPPSVEDEGVMDIVPGKSATHVAIEFNLGGMTAWTGYSSIETNKGAVKKPEAADKPATGDIMADYTRKPASETKVTHVGLRGSLGDNGLGFVASFQSVDTDGVESNPYDINLTKSLGDGATAIFSHNNLDDGTDATSWVGLQLNF